jgi:hypothetical protein
MSEGPAPVWKRMVAGGMHKLFASLKYLASSGALAAFICNPIELAKTRLQAEAAGALIVRPQFGYKGITDCFKRMYQEEVASLLYFLTSSREFLECGKARL